MLDALAVELHQEFLDLAAALGGLLVQRNADQAVRCRHGLGRQAGVFALDVEVADLAEVEQLLVEPGPVFHATAVHVVRQVVDQAEAVALGMAVHAFMKDEVDVVDGFAILEAVDQVQRRTANALDGRQLQFHRAGGNVHRLCAQLQRALVGVVRILHAESHAAGAGPMFRRKVGAHAARLAVDDEIDVALAVQHHVLGAVLRHFDEAHALQHRLDHARRGGGELHKLEAHQAHRVLEKICHVCLLLVFFCIVCSVPMRMGGICRTNPCTVGA